MSFASPPIGPYLLLYIALVGFFAFAAIYHLILWSTSRREALLAVVGVDSAIRAALSVVLVLLMTAATPAEADSAYWVRVGLVLVTFITTIWSVRLISGVRAPGLVWTLTVLSGVAVLIHLLVTPLNTTVESVESSVMPWGETIARPVLGTPGWWVAPIFLLGYAIQGFALYGGAVLWRRDRVAGLYILLATIGTLAIYTLEAGRSLGLAAAPVFGAVPNILWVCAMALVVARGHRRTRLALIASEHRFRGIFDQTFQFIGLLRTDGVVIEVNRTSLEFAGATASEVIGRPLWETPWWSHSADLQQRLRRAIESAAAGRMVRFEATHPRFDGRLADVDFSVKPVRDARGNVTLLIPEGRDITERTDAEAKRRALEFQLTQAQKMEAIGQVAGGVAHDFNNLLTVINGNGELLLKSTPAPDPRRPMVEDIVAAGTRASMLTRQLLMFTRRQVEEPQVLDLNAVVAENERILRRLLGDDLVLRTELHPALPKVRADPGQLGQVILNLAVNGRDAMPDGGTLTITTQNVQVARDAPPAAHPVARPGPYVVLGVADTGQGMTPEVRARIFEPFFTTKEPGKGTGVGLATVRTIAEQSGGFLQVHSAPGQGSVFKLYLPALAADAMATSTDAHQSAVVMAAATILLVEDDDAVRALARQVLRSQGHTVLEAAGAEIALHLAEAHTGTIDLLLTDVVMPDVGGRELAERLALVRPKTRVLYMSGYTDDAVVRHGVREAEVAFLQKPFSIEALTAKVRQVLDAA